MGSVFSPKTPKVPEPVETKSTEEITAELDKRDKEDEGRARAAVATRNRQGKFGGTVRSRGTGLFDLVSNLGDSGSGKTILG